MKHRISVILILSLMLSMLFIPLAVSAQEGKSIIKDMVQAPADYIVGFDQWKYGIVNLWDRYFMGYNDSYNRINVYYPDWVFWRLSIVPGKPVLTG